MVITHTGTIVELRREDGVESIAILLGPQSTQAEIANIAPTAVAWRDRLLRERPSREWGGTRGLSFVTAALERRLSGYSWLFHERGLSYNRVAWRINQLLGCLIRRLGKLASSLGVDNTSSLMRAAFERWLREGQQTEGPSRDLAVVLLAYEWLCCHREELNEPLARVLSGQPPFPKINGRLEGPATYEKIRERVRSFRNSFRRAPMNRRGSEQPQPTHSDP